MLALLGQPGGMYVYPKDRAGVVLVYLFVETDRHPFGATVKQRQKLLTVSLDAQGVVSDVAYTASEPK